MKTTARKALIVISVLLLLLPNISPVTAINLNLEYPEIAGFDLNRDQELNEAIAWLYYFIITIAGMAVFAMLVWGGFTWVTSTGDASKIANARERIYSAFLGLILILASFIIMKTINPELVVLKLPGVADTCPGFCTDPFFCSPGLPGHVCDASPYQCEPPNGCCCVPGLGP